MSDSGREADHNNGKQSQDQPEKARKTQPADIGRKQENEKRNEAAGDIDQLHGIKGRLKRRTKTSGKISNVSHKHGNSQKKPVYVLHPPGKTDKHYIQ